MRKVVLAVIAAITVMSVCVPAQAYMCWWGRDISDKARDADAVFTGEIVQIDDIGVEDEELGTSRSRILFFVDEVWKGLGRDQVEAFVDVEGIYEYDFKVGESYLVYAYRIYDGRLSAVGCPRVMPISEVAGEVGSLGIPRMTGNLELSPASGGYVTVKF